MFFVLLWSLAIEKHIEPLCYCERKLWKDCVRFFISVTMYLEGCRIFRPKGMRDYLGNALVLGRTRFWCKCTSVAMSVQIYLIGKESLLRNVFCRRLWIHARSFVPFSAVRRTKNVTPQHMGHDRQWKSYAVFHKLWARRPFDVYTIRFIVCRLWLLCHARATTRRCYKTRVRTNRPMSSKRRNAAVLVIHRRRNNLSVAIGSKRDRLVEIFIISWKSDENQTG